MTESLGRKLLIAIWDGLIMAAVFLGVTMWMSILTTSEVRLDSPPPSIHTTIVTPSPSPVVPQIGEAVAASIDPTTGETHMAVLR